MTTKAPSSPAPALAAEALAGGAFAGEVPTTSPTELASRLGTPFTNPSLLEQALTHTSYRNENARQGASSAVADNERLEFLGDAVLDLALSALLMARFPTDREGALSKKRASLVNEDVLAALARELEIPELIRLGKGERQSGGVGKPRILASAFEAVFGAIYLDSGFAVALAATDAAFGRRLDALAGSPDYAADFKTRLQERSQERHRQTPFYRVERERGPDHDKLFDVSVRLGERVLAIGQGRNKKAAEQEAARLALEKLSQEEARDEMTAPDAASERDGGAAPVEAEAEAPGDGEGKQ